MHMMKRLLIFTDLDGTLLDHYDYSFQAASHCLTTLNALKIPYILNTSKTRSELTLLRQALQHQDAFIVENGAAIYYPKSLLKTPTSSVDNELVCQILGPKRATILAHLQDAKRLFTFTALSELSDASLSQCTGLSLEQARLAQQREFTEPLIWQDSESALQRFNLWLKPLALKTQRGGRFLQVMGIDCDKALAMQHVTCAYEHFYETAVTTLALGDGENDIGMLSLADIAVVVRSPAHHPPTIPGRTDVWLTEQYGPSGWAESVSAVLALRGLQ
jgi:mannosyl-3-phosphoglycerate phosphatase